MVWLKGSSSKTTPICSRSAAVTPSCPKAETLPLSGLQSPRIRRMVVDLPAPFSPISPMMLPFGSEKLTFCNVNCE